MGLEHAARCGSAGWRAKPAQRRDDCSTFNDLARTQAQVLAEASGHQLHPTGRSSTTPVGTVRQGRPSISVLSSGVCASRICSKRHWDCRLSSVRNCQSRDVRISSSETCSKNTAQPRRMLKRRTCVYRHWSWCPRAISVMWCVRGWHSAASPISVMTGMPARCRSLITERVCCSMADGLPHWRMPN